MRENFTILQQTVQFTTSFAWKHSLTLRTINRGMFFTFRWRVKGSHEQKSSCFFHFQEGKNGRSIKFSFVALSSPWIAYLNLSKKKRLSSTLTSLCMLNRIHIHVYIKTVISTRLKCCHSFSKKISQFAFTVLFFSKMMNWTFFFSFRLLLLDIHNSQKKIANYTSFSLAVWFDIITIFFATQVKFHLLPRMTNNY